MGIILLKMPQWLISVFNWFTLSSMKKIIITQMLIAIIITMFDKACEIILKGPCVWDIQDVVAFIILDTVLIIKQMNYLLILSKTAFEEIHLLFFLLFYQ